MARDVTKWCRNPWLFAAMGLVAFVFAAMSFLTDVLLLWVFGYPAWARLPVWAGGPLFSSLAILLVAVGFIFLCFAVWVGLRRTDPLRCGSCGYDRHGLTADAKCPECGTVPAPAA